MIQWSSAICTSSRLVEVSVILADGKLLSRLMDSLHLRDLVSDTIKLEHDNMRLSSSRVPQDGRRHLFRPCGQVIQGVMRPRPSSPFKGPSRLSSAIWVASRPKLQNAVPLVDHGDTLRGDVWSRLLTFGNSRARKQDRQGYHKGRTHLHRV